MTQLTYLNLGFNAQLHGPLPRELIQLTQLKTLMLKGNFLSGTIPTELGRLTSLYELRLGKLFVLDE